MTEPLLTLMTWMSPAFPVGAFTYSHGLETAVAEGLVTDATATAAWIGDCLAHGAGRNDAILLAEAWRAADNPALIDELAEFAEALQPSAERLLESTAQGRAFALASEAAWGGDGKALPYPIAVGVAAARIGVPVEETAAAYLHGFASNLVSAAIRLVPIGQNDGQRVLAALLPLCRGLAAEAANATLDDIGGCTLSGDIASMRHETQEVRIFRS